MMIQRYRYLMHKLKHRCFNIKIKQLYSLNKKKMKLQNKLNRMNHSSGNFRVIKMLNLDMKTNKYSNKNN